MIDTGYQLHTLGLKEHLKRCFSKSREKVGSDDADCLPIIILPRCEDIVDTSVRDLAPPA